MSSVGPGPWRSIGGYLRRTTVGDGQPPYTPLAQDISDLVGGQEQDLVACVGEVAFDEVLDPASFSLSTASRSCEALPCWPR
jgi:hypothetical protein